MSGKDAAQHQPSKTTTTSTGTETHAEAPSAPWWRRSAFPAAAWSGLLLWAALPSLDWTPLAPLAPLGWLWLIRLPQLPGRRPYRAIYLASALHWLAVLHGVRHPHPALWAGWFAMSFYLAIYVPLFVAFTRGFVHRLKWPLVVAAPVAWVATELARGYVITGFSMGLLGHTLVHWPALIQIAEYGGAYLVSALVMVVAVGLSQLAPLAGERRRLLPLGFAALAVLSALICDAVKDPLSTRATIREGHIPRIAVVQGGWNVFYTFDPELNDRMFDTYQEQTIEARDEALSVQRPLDLVIWPESSFPAHVPELRIEANGFALSTEGVKHQQQFDERLRTLARLLNERASGPTPPLPVVVGGETIVLRGNEQEERYNSAWLVDPQGRIADRYAKMHPVMFGEYLPFGDWFPILYQITPMPAGLTRGPGPNCFEVAGLRLAPDICFEITVPHLIRRQMAELRRQGRTPDVLINLSNDGWFHGSNFLDLQANCGVFRAVELRRPVLIAANGGRTRWIDCWGRIEAELPRLQVGHLVAEPWHRSQHTLYERTGDWFAVTCLLLCLLPLLAAVRRGRSAVS